MALKRWIFSQPEEQHCRELAQEWGVSSLAAKVLLSRGYNRENGGAFLYPQPFFDPFLLKDMDRAVERIHEAINHQERIAVYGDYDCDGVTAMTMLSAYLESAGADVVRYIPDREKEGYGLNKRAVRWLQSQGVNLIITVDNGISAREEIAFAKELGVDVVVTDHHQPPEILPEAAAVVDPHRRDCPSPYKSLCGAGVAFKLICALEGDDGQEMMEYYGELLTLATVGDVVELTGENRAIVQKGLPLLEQTENPGLHSLLKISGLSGKPLTSEGVAFGLVPRINAAGRLGQIEKAVELLMAEDEEEAQELAEEIQNLNQQRRELEQQILKEISALLEQTPSLLKGRLLILSGENWHPGVIGIVASKLVDRFGKPCLLISREGEQSRGSARSIEGFSIIEAITGCQQYLTRFGGHEMAAGCSLQTSQIEAFAQELENWARRKFDLMPVAPLRLDASLTPADLTIQSVKQLSALEPFGCGNEQPFFLLPNAEIRGITPIGEGKHLRLQLALGEQKVGAVYFNMPPDRFPYRVGQRVDAAVQLDVNLFRGEETLSVKIREMRFTGFDQEALVTGWQLYEKYLRREGIPDQWKQAVAPHREDIALLYRFLREKGPYWGGDELLYTQLAPKDMNFCKMRFALDVLRELGLVKRGKGVLAVVAGAGKVELEKSALFRKFQGVTV